MVDKKVSYAQGYTSKTDKIDYDLVTEAVELAKSKDVVVLMIGLTDIFESEGFDRTHLNIPNNHIYLLEEVYKVNKNIVACLSNGSPIVMPWKDKTKAIVEQYLGGQASGEALVDVLYGKVNPSGKLAETFPNSLVEFPSNQNFPGLPRQVQYREGLYVGYRYYDKVNLEPLYPFGYGLSYTTFEYSDLNVKEDKESIELTFNVTNTGKVDGKEVSQVYVSINDSKVYRPNQELKGYTKTLIKASETKEVKITLDKKDLEVYQDGFKLENGVYNILVGSSSRDIHLSKTLELKGLELKDDDQEAYKNITSDFTPTEANFEKLLGDLIPKYPEIKPFTMNSVIGEMQSTFVGRKLKGVMKSALNDMLDDDVDESMKVMMERMVDEMPFRGLVMMSAGKVSEKRAHGLLDLMNGKFFKGLFKTIKG